MSGELRFHAMGSDAHVLVVGGPDGLVEQARARIDCLEAKWSRFRPDSEVSQLTRCSGAPVTVSADTVTLVQRADEAWRLTGGAFNATVLGDVLRAGYDRSFEQLDADVAPGDSLLVLGAADIEVRGDEVTLPPGTGFDPGGIGKGLAADIVTAELVAAGAEGACVNLGGDLRAAGSAPDGRAWTVAVEIPDIVEPLALLGIASGAVATSTTLRRRWRTGGELRHHLIDAASGEPSGTDLVLATVVTDQAWIAEVLAKAVLLRGAAHPFDLIEGTGAAAIAIDESGAVVASDDLGAFLGGRPLPSSITLPPTPAGKEH